MHASIWARWQRRAWSRECVSNQCALRPSAAPGGDGRARRSIGSLLVLSLLMVVMTPLRAQPVNLAVAAKAASCNACHGPYGRSDAGIPPLAGRSADELYAALAGFKTGSRAAFVMHQHAKGYSDEELRDIAVEFSRQKPTRERK